MLLQQMFTGKVGKAKNNHFPEKAVKSAMLRVFAICGNVERQAGPMRTFECIFTNHRSLHGAALQCHWLIVSATLYQMISPVISASAIGTAKNTLQIDDIIA